MVAWGWRPAAEACRPDSVEQLLGEALEAGFTFISVPLEAEPKSHCQVESNDNLSLYNSQGQSLSLQSLASRQPSLIAACDLCFREEWFNRVVLEFAFFDEFLLQYAEYLSVCAVLVLVTEEAEVERFRRWHRERGEPFQLWLQFPASVAGWCRWAGWSDGWRSHRVKAALLLGDDDDEFGEAWIAESVGALITTSRTSRIVERFISADETISVILNSVPLSKVQSGSSAVSSAVQSSAMNNVLLSPLQPLQDHLAAETYRCFEEDPVKYQLYQEAVREALTSLSSRHSSVSVVVAGAGRGPLVTAVLEAAEEVPAVRLDRLLVIEKNPFAGLTLLRRFNSHPRVTILLGDMRCLNLEEEGPFHLIVSELLGSLGDNELAPECLWPLQRFLTPDGVMIPQRYTSWLQPAYAPTIGEPKSIGLHVSKLTKVHFWNTQPQALFTFHHPDNSNGEESERASELVFNRLPGHAVIDCLVGYFECVLFGPVRMSTVPATHSPGLGSWYPAYLALPEPMKVGADGQVTVRFRRKRREKKVWYEWSVSGEVTGEWHNVDGKSYCMNL